MFKIFVTGDNHIGRKYDRYPNVRETLVQSRIDSMERMVQQAEQEECGLFVVTGDLFDSISTVRTGDVKQTAEVLSKFNGSVLVLPGNHDYYTGEEKVWKDFEKSLLHMDHNITVLTEFRPYFFEVGEEQVVIYPAFCQSKHSRENNLAWIKNTELKPNKAYHIGIAHGAIKGITPDLKEEYFLMTEAELLDIPLDVWLIGHTHIPWPSLEVQEETEGYRIFNAGTHEQTDFHNHTEGCCFILTLDRAGGRTRVNAHKYVSGKIKYYDLKLHVTAGENHSLEQKLMAAVGNLSAESVVRVRIAGTVKPEEYEERKMIYQNVLSRFLSYEYADAELSEEITVEKIRNEFSEMSFAAKFMERLIENPVELQMAYQLVKECSD